MNNEKMAFEIAKQFVAKENEIFALRELLRRSWGNLQDRPWEPLYDSGFDQLQSHKKYYQRCEQLQSAFRAAKDDGSLIQALHDQLLRRMNVPQD